MDNTLKETLELLKAGKRAGGLAYIRYDGVEYVRRSEVIALEGEYWAAQDYIKELELALDLDSDLPGHKPISAGQRLKELTGRKPVRIPPIIVDDWDG